MCGKWVPFELKTYTLYSLNPFCFSWIETWIPKVDCWDPDDKKSLPLVKHGGVNGITFAGIISFAHVLSAINVYAFVSSDYPVILSIEDHCCSAVQQKMAEEFVKVFGGFFLWFKFYKFYWLDPSKVCLRGLRVNFLSQRVKICFCCGYTNIFISRI